MRPKIPKEISGPARTELINVRTRLRDELTTCRYGLDLPASPPRGYKTVCRAVAGSSGEPIPGQFFAAEFKAFTAQVPNAAKTRGDDLEKVILGLADPWRLQAWAAQVRRIALDAETSDSKHAALVWRKALRFYTEFFERAQVEDSHTFRNDPASQDDARAAWDSFLADELADMVERMAAHGRRQDPGAVAACAAVLSSPDAVAIDPEAAAIGASKGLDAFVDGVAAATSLEAAVKLASQAPVKLRQLDQRGELDRALLAAMTKEAELLAKGFGDVAQIQRAAEVAKLGPNSHAEASATRKAALAEFYDACSAFARHALGDDVDRSAKHQAADLLELLPSDWEVGKDGTTGRSIEPAAVIELLFHDELGTELKKLFNELATTPADSQAEEDALDAVVAFAKREPRFAAGPQTAEALRQALSGIFHGAFQASGGDQSSRGWRMMSKIAGALPVTHEIEIRGVSATAIAHMERIKRGEATGIGLEAKFGGIIRKLMAASAGGAAEGAALDELLRFARAQRAFVGQPVESEVLRKALVAIFGSSASRVLEDWGGNERSREMMAKIVDFLPGGTKTDLGGETLTLKEHSDRVNGLGLLKAVRETPYGSSSEREAAAALTDLLDHGVRFSIGGTQFAEVARAALARVASADSSSPRASTATSALANRSGSKSRPTSISGPRPSRATKIVAVIITVAIWGLILFLAVKYWPVAVALAVLVTLIWGIRKIVGKRRG
jgi:hypothetical protein